MEKPEEIFEVSIAAHTTIGQLKRLVCRNSTKFVFC